VALRHDPRIWRGDRSLLITKDGERAADADVAVFTQHERPHGVGVDQKWIAVSINEGTLVAYRGDQPVMAALISPGMHGANPDGAYRTPPGRHRISSKWLTHDMTGPLGTGAWRSRDVPWVAYYDDSFAIHGAWWHDSFGRPRSHGCVNLTPSDARRLFAWMDPQLPSGWYAVRAQGDEGTLVVISP
jgi:hypothetical protein